MAPNGIVFALSNPDPEIHPEVAAKYAAVVATGRSDFLNQINNVLAFPGVFRGALDAGARRITEKMKVAAAEAIFSVVGDDLAPEYIVPSPLTLASGPLSPQRSRRPRATEPSDPRRARLVVALLGVLLVAGCTTTTTSGSIAVGARKDPQSTLLASLYASALRTYGTAAHVEVLPDPLTGLDSADATVVPGFTGRLLDTFAPGAKARAAAQVYRDMVSALPEGVAAGDFAEAAEDKPALAVTESTVDAWRGRDVTVAVRNCDKLKVGQVADTPRPATVGPCKPKVSDYPNPAKLFEALRIGQINAAWTSSADRGSPPTRWC